MAILEAVEDSLPNRLTNLTCVYMFSGHQFLVEALAFRSGRLCLVN
jgi:hypothetical protein